MKRIQVLDCTLRDGGYINSWNFGQKAIQSVVSGLIESKVDYVECGYFNENADDTSCDSTQFKNERQINNTIKDINLISKPVIMIDYNKYDVNNLLEKEYSSIYGIRLAFHKNDLQKIQKCCEIIKKKGYQLFLQPMVTISYSDEELVELIQLANCIKPYAFYIVDSFGSLKKSDLQRMLYLVDHNLNKDIILGFHSHNNLQLAYSNAQLVTQLQTNRQIIIDACVFGMGRGAGNLNTELFIEYLNDYYLGNYLINPLLCVIDHTLNRIYNEKYWGYSLAHYISAVYNCHPNYATYLSQKNSLFLDDIENIISKMDDTHKEHYSDAYAEKMYINYMNKQIIRDVIPSELVELFGGQRVLMLGPGKSVLEEDAQISQLLESENVILVSINCICEWLKQKIDFIFVSNKRRFDNISPEWYEKLIMTTNIKCDDAAYKISYDQLLNQQAGVEDNGGMMFLKLMLFLNVDKVYIAGVDGFSYDMNENYFNEDMKFPLDRERMCSINYGMKKLIEEFSEKMNIEFLNQPKFLQEES